MQLKAKSIKQMWKEKSDKGWEIKKDGGTEKYLSIYFIVKLIWTI